MKNQKFKLIISILISTFLLMCCLSGCITPNTGHRNSAKNSYYLDTSIPMFSKAQWETLTASELIAYLDSGAEANICNGNAVSALMAAAMFNSDPAIVTILMERGANVIGWDEYGFTALIYAAEQNPNPEVVEALIAGGAEIDKPDFKGRTALYYSLFNETTSENLATLIRFGADVSYPDMYGATPLMHASLSTDSNSLVNIEMLINAGAEIDAVHNGGNTALIFAAQNSGCEKNGIALLSAGADVSLKNENGGTALYYAAANSDSSFVKALLEAGADPNVSYPGNYTYFEYPIMNAVKNSDAGVIDLLVEYGADIEARNEYGLTPILTAASAAEDYQIIRTLIKNGADKTALSDLSGSQGAKVVAGGNILMFAARNSSDSAPDIVRSVLSLAPDVNYTDAGGRTALLLAARYSSSPEVIDILIQAGARLLRDNNNKTIYDYAKEQSSGWYADITKQIRTSYDDLWKTMSVDELRRKIRTSGRSYFISYDALGRAAEANPSPDFIQVLIEQIYNLSSDSEYIADALQDAAKHNPNPDVTETLINALKTSGDISNLLKKALNGSISSNQNLEVVKEIMQSDFLTDWTRNDRDKLLASAKSRHTTDAYEYLLSLGEIPLVFDVSGSLSSVFTPQIRPQDGIQGWTGGNGGTIELRIEDAGLRDGIQTVRVKGTYARINAGIESIDRLYPIKEGSYLMCDVRGADGTSGGIGKTGTPGFNGGKGGDGGNGGDGGKVSIVLAGIKQKPDWLIYDISGGDGGAGGRGGHGGEARPELTTPTMVSPGRTVLNVLGGYDYIPPVYEESVTQSALPAGYAGSSGRSGKQGNSGTVDIRVED